MIVLLHGTGDDNLKPENWMSSVKEIMAPHEKVLILPGVASEEKGKLFEYAEEFLSSLDIPSYGPLRAPRRIALDPRTPQSLERDLRSASSSRSEFFPFVVQNKLSDDPRENLRLIRTQLDKRNTFASGISAAGPENKGYLAVGIKSRAAIVAICGYAYHQYFTSAPGQIRIIGHSRGGAAAIAAHNLLRFFGISNVRTLTLDPCHGLKKFGAKNYTHKVFSGLIMNIPAVREVGGTSLLGGTLRQPITKGVDADSDCIVFNHAKLEKIAHGHMGKLDTFASAGFFQRGQSRVRINNAKTESRNDLLNKVNAIDRRNQCKKQIQDLFGLTNQNRSDFSDKKIIYEYVEWLLFDRDWNVPSGLVPHVKLAIQRWRKHHTGLQRNTSSSESRAAAAKLESLIEAIENHKREAPNGDENRIRESHLRYAVAYYLNCNIKDGIESQSIDLGLAPGRNIRLSSSSALHNFLRKEVFLTNQFSD